MIENALAKKQFSLQIKITVKSLISAGIIALAVILPQIAHLALGAKAGIMLLPMYLPVVLGGCLLGPVWGLGIGLLSPVASFIITSFLGNPMPALARLPFMVAELAVFATVSGLFSKKIAKNALYAFPAVILSELAGRLSFLALAALFQNRTPFNVPMIWGQIKTGVVGLVIQAVLVPLAVMCLKELLDKEQNK